MSPQGLAQVFRVSHSLTTKRPQHRNLNLNLNSKVAEENKEKED